MIRLSKPQILLLHEQLIAETGGSSGLRDEGMLCFFSISLTPFIFRSIFLVFSSISCDFIDFIHQIAYNKIDTTRKEASFMIVTATEFKTNFGKYLELIAKEDVFITRNGKIIAKVVNPQISAVDSLRGILKDVPADLDLDSIREEKLSKYEDHV